MLSSLILHVMLLTSMQFYHLYIDNKQMNISANPVPSGVWRLRTLRTLQ